ncbi:MAG: hypothetical protein HC923_05655, partial [Myxococcales bacterium]|nr:hypothetical protein [Myxococcales bacterium]
VQAEVMGEPAPDLLDAGDRRSRTDDAMAALRAKVAAKQLSAGASSKEPVDVDVEPEEVVGEGRSASAVEDSLAELKKKLRPAD